MTRACSRPTSCRRCSAPPMPRTRPRIRGARPAPTGSPSATLCSVCTLKIKPTPDALRVNPLRQAEGFVRQQTRNRLFSSVFAELQLGRGFSYRVNFGPDLGNRMDGQFQGANVVLNQ